MDENHIPVSEEANAWMDECQEGGESVVMVAVDGRWGGWVGGWFEWWVGCLSGGWLGWLFKWWVGGLVE